MVPQLTSYEANIERRSFVEYEDLLIREWDLHLGTKSYSGIEDVTGQHEDTGTDEEEGAVSDNVEE